MGCLAIFLLVASVALHHLNFIGLAGTCAAVGFYLLAMEILFLLWHTVLRNRRD